VSKYQVRIAVDEANRYQALPRIGESEGQSSSETGTVGEEFLRGPSPTGELLDGEKLLAKLLPDRFEILKVLGRGSFGVVFYARDSRLARDVALKVLRPEWNAHPTVRTRFLRESRAAARLNHTSIVRVLEADEYQGIAWQVCDVIEGTTLSRLIAKGPLPRSVAVRFVADLAAAVDLAHRSGIVHRDIKPDNILVKLGQQEDLSDGSVYLADFGLAKILDDEGYETREGYVVGTPKYLAPELMESNAKCDYKLADVYSLGVVLFECLTGKNPYFAASNAVQRVRQETKRVASIRDINRALPIDLDAVCKKAMAYYPDQRYVTPALLANDLQAWFAGLPTEARPLMPYERLWRLAKENPVLVAMVAAIIICLSIIALISIRSNQTYVAQQLQLKKTNSQLKSEVQAAESLRTDVEQQREKFKYLAWQSGIREAYQAWKDNSLWQARNRLNRLQVTHEDATQRPEWKLLAAQLDSKLRTLRVSDAAIEEVRTLPGQDAAVAVSQHGEVIYLPESMAPKPLFETEGNVGLYALAVHPSQPLIYYGGTVDPVSDRSYVREYDLTTKSVRNLAHDLATTIESIEVASNGDHLFAGSRYENPIMMRLSDGTKHELTGNRSNRWVGRIQLDREAFVYQRDTAALGIADIDSGEMREVRFDVDVFSNTMLFAAVIPQSPFVAIVFSNIRGMLIFDCQKNEVVGLLHRDVTTNISCSAFSPSRNLLAMGTESGELQVWDLASEPWWQTYRSNGSSSTRESHPAVVVINKSLPEEGFRPPLIPIARWSVSQQSIQTLAFSDNYVFSGTRAGEVIRMKLSDFDRNNRTNSIAPINLESPLFSSWKSLWSREDGDLFLIQSNGEICGIEQQKLQSLFDSESSESNSIGAFGASKMAQVGLQRLIEKATPLRAEEELARPIKLSASANGEVVVSLKSPHELIVWRGTQIAEVLPMQKIDDAQLLLSVAPDGSCALLRNANGRLYLVPLENNERQFIAFEFNEIVTHVDWHLTDQRLVVSGDLNKIFEIDLKQQALRNVGPVTSAVTEIVYYDEGTKVATGHLDGSIQLTDLKSRTTQKFSVHPDETSSIVIDSKHQIGISADRFGGVVLWSLADAEVIGELQRPMLHRMRVWSHRPSLWHSSDGTELRLLDVDNSELVLSCWRLGGA
jgi:serine/threonine protein kinase